MKRPKGQENLFPTFVFIPTDFGWEDDHERASGCQESISNFLCFFDRYRVKDVGQGGRDELADAFYERSVGQVAIEDVRCTERAEQVLVVG